MDMIIEQSKKRKISSQHKIELSNHSEFGIKLGTEDRNNPKACWMLITTWLSSDFFMDEEYIKKLDYRIRKLLWNEHDDFVFNPDRTISILEYTNTATNLAKRKPHYITFDITLWQTPGECIRWDDYNLQMSMEYYAELIIEELKSIEGLHFQSRRKSKT